jgi:hypothetical protein
MNPLGVLILFVVLVVVSAASRRWALMGMMAGTLYLTQGQQFNVFGFNLYAVRFMELAGFIRVMARREFSFSKLNGIDRSLLLLYVGSTIIFLLRSSDIPKGQAYQIGTALDAILCYITFRGLVGGMEDFRWFLRNFLILLAPYALLILFESMTGRNPFFSVLGGDVYGDWMRNGRPRCLGSFRHPSLLGTLGASFIPLYIGLACTRVNRKLAFFGIGLCLLIVWASNSGGPANCAMIGVVGWLLWPARTRMKLIRRLMLAGTILLAMVMKAPIWYLPAKASGLTGGDGWHRSYLMDVSFQHFDNWWLAGMPIDQTNGWFPYDLAATGGADITNQFLSFGLTAGVAAMILFFVMLYLAFRHLGKAMAIVRSHYNGADRHEFLLWGLGAMLVAHIFNWLGITYFDQTYVIWFMQLAAITSLSEECIHSATIEVLDERHADTEADQGRPVTAGDRNFASEVGPAPTADGVI